ncbi:MAG: DegT/DnrJ/EryC1/StrS family aminotransferase [Pseudomonadota bacterium]
MLGKLRPVGSRVPLPSSETVPLPWAENYTAEYCASGTDALALAVGLAVLRKPDVANPEVIIPAYGCPDLVAAILCQGAKPVLVDLVRDAPLMDSQRLLDALTERTVAVVGAGLLGIPERLDVLADICRENSLSLIEDSAQCFPPQSADLPLADFVVLSFGRGKPINLMGGGALLYRGTLSENQQQFLGRQPTETVITGLRWRLKRYLFNLLLTRTGFGLLERIPFLGLGRTRFQPHKGITRRNLPSGLLHGALIDHAARPLPHKQYEQELRGLESEGWLLFGSSRFAMNPAISRLRFGVLVPDRGLRDSAVSALNAAGIGANGLYEVALPDLEGLSSLMPPAEFPVASEFAGRLLTLPSHEDVTQRDVKLIAKVLLSVNSTRA